MKSANSSDLQVVSMELMSAGTNRVIAGPVAAMIRANAKRAWIKVY